MVARPPISVFMGACLLHTSMLCLHAPSGTSASSGAKSFWGFVESVSTSLLSGRPSGRKLPLPRQESQHLHTLFHAEAGFVRLQSCCCRMQYPPQEGLLHVKAYQPLHAQAAVCHRLLFGASGAAPPPPGPQQHGASEEVAQAVHANEAAMREVLQLSRVSVASSGTGSNGEPDVDMEYQCPICLV